MDDNNLECPRCGEVFSMEFSRCPKCGLSMYPEDEEDDSVGLYGMHADEIEERASGVGDALLAVFLGLILAGAVSFVLHMFASRTGTAESLPTGWRVVLFFAAPVSALVGGYASGAFEKRARPSATGLGALVGVGAAALGVLFETRWRLVTAQVLVEPSMLAQYALCILFGSLGGWLRGDSGAATLAGVAHPPQKEVKGMSWEDLMYRDLLTRVRYNRDTAERLIEHERRLAPEAERFTLISNAIDRLDHDRKNT